MAGITRATGFSMVLVPRHELAGVLPVFKPFAAIHCHVAILDEVRYQLMRKDQGQEFLDHCRVPRLERQDIA